MTDDSYVDLHDLAMQTDFNTEDTAMQWNLKQVRVQAETTAIKRALVCADNNISQAAKLLGVTRPTLYTLFAKYEIEGHEGHH